MVLYAPFAGQSVADLIANDVPIVERRAAAALRQAAAALQFARIRSNRHGLFCAEFLLLSRTSEDAKVMGFGFDRLYYALQERNAADVERYAACLPPDQFVFKNPTFDDVYGLGLVGYQMLTGKLLYCEGSVKDISRRKLMPLPTPQQLNPKLSPQISDLIMELLDADPLRRANLNAVLDLLAPQTLPNGDSSPADKDAGFDLKALKLAAAKIRLPDNLVGSKKRMINILFTAAVMVVLTFSLILISYMSGKSDQRFQAVYEEFLVENRIAVLPTAAAPSRPLTAPEEKPNVKVERSEAMTKGEGSVSGAGPSIREQKPPIERTTLYDLVIERPPFADQVRIGSQTWTLPAQVSLPLGNHPTMFLDSLFGFVWQTTVEVREDSPSIFRVDPALVGLGDLLVILKNASDFGYVFVTIDDKNEEHATPYRTQLYAGRHRLRMYRENLTVSPDDTVVFVMPNVRATIQVTAF